MWGGGTDPVVGVAAEGLVDGDGVVDGAFAAEGGMIARLVEGGAEGADQFGAFFRRIQLQLVGLSQAR